MALTQFDLNNPLRFWSAKVIAKASTTNTEILLYKIRNFNDATSEIVTTITRLSEDFYCTTTASLSDPTSYDVDSLTIFDKFTKQPIATWYKTDFTDAAAIFVNHGSNGVNYATWVAFTQAIIDATKTI